jgi:hypothetical protein
MNFIISLQIYPYDIWFSIGESNAKFVTSLADRLTDEQLIDLKDDIISTWRPTLRGRTYHSLIGGQTIIRLPKRPRTAVELGTLSHEIFHACEFICRRIGLQLNEGSDEAYAYMIGYVTEKFWERMGK